MISFKSIWGSIAVCLTLLIAVENQAFADQSTPNPIRLTSSSIVSEFPTGFRVKAEVQGTHDIVEIALRMKIGQRTRGVYEYMGDQGGLVVGGRGRTLELTPRKESKAELFWFTNSTSRYIPPGTIITYSFEIKDSESNILQSDDKEFVYLDARYEWAEVSKGDVTVAYHGPVKKRAEDVLQTVTSTLNIVSPILGAEQEDPVRVTIYNNAREIIDAYPPRYGAIGHGVIVDGQAHVKEGVLLLDAGGRDALGTASHEITHIIVHRATENTTGQGLPSWLGEGLAEFGNLHQTVAYDIALEFAIATDRILPIMFMRGQPSKGEDIIIFYGQARSVVRWLVVHFGPEKMQQFLALIKEGDDLDTAFIGAYGQDRVGITNLWRSTVGASEYIPPDTQTLKPTPVPQKALGLFSLTPQAGVTTIQSQEANTNEGGASPSPAANPANSSSSTVEEENQNPSTPSTGSGCFTTPQATGNLDLTVVGMLVGFVMLANRPRRWRL